MDVQSAQEKNWSSGWKVPYERSHELAHRFGVEMPIAENLSSIILRKKTREAALTLLGRARKDDAVTKPRNAVTADPRAGEPTLSHRGVSMSCEELEFVWNNINGEARTLADCEPMLASFTQRYQHENVAITLSMLANNVIAMICLLMLS